MVRFSVRSVLTVIALVIAAWALLSILAITREVISWVLVSIFLALALNPAVEWFMRHGFKRRSAAAAGHLRPRDRGDRRASASSSSRRSSIR